MNLLKGFGKHFIYGLLTLLPLFITFAILGWVVIHVNNAMGKNSYIGVQLGKIAERTIFPHSFILIVSYLVAILVIAFFGFLVRKYARIRITENIKKIFEHFPVVNTIYTAAEQVVGFIGKRDENLGKFGEVVIVKYANMMVVGLLASRNPCLIDGVPHVMIYFPSTPMPASGFNYLVPVENVYLSDLDLESMSKIVISLGALTPQIFGEEIKTRKLVDVLSSDA